MASNGISHHLASSFITPAVYNGVDYDGLCHYAPSRLAWLVLKHFGVQRLILHHLQSSHGSIDLDWMGWVGKPSSFPSHLGGSSTEKGAVDICKKTTTNKIEREIPDIRWLCYRKVKYYQVSILRINRRQRSHSGVSCCPNHGSLLLVIIILQVVQSFPAQEKSLKSARSTSLKCPTGIIIFSIDTYQKAYYHLMDISHFSQFSDTTPGSQG